MERRGKQNGNGHPTFSKSSIKRVGFAGPPHSAGTDGPRNIFLNVDSASSPTLHVYCGTWGMGHGGWDIARDKFTVITIRRTIQQIKMALKVSQSGNMLV
jgi:hypothetical protein